MKIETGTTFAPRQLTSIGDTQVDLPDAQTLVHLQMRRYAGCPICNLHLKEFTRRHEEVSAAGVREVIVFNSQKSEMLPYQRELPFVIVADPERKLYDELGVETSPRAILDPRVMPASMKGVFGKWSLPSRVKPMLGLPADFLIGRDGRVLAAKYGIHADDGWSVDELLALAATARA